MKAKFFSRSYSFFHSSINTANLEQEINAWLASHPNIKVVDIKHSGLANTWSYTQFVATIYYTEALS